MHDNVVVTQRGRRARSDIAYISYNAAQSHVRHIRMQGHVRVEQAQGLVLGKRATLDMVKHQYQVSQGWYRFHPMTGSKQSHYWGKAKHFTQSSRGDWIVKEGSISSCSPVDPFWQLAVGKMTYHRQQQQVTGTAGVLKIKQVPVFYLPYFSFPVGHSRRSGWLIPTWDNQSKTGFGFGVPYYWNLAPNYDLLLTPTWWTRRGVMLGGQFRYLTTSSSGFVKLNGLFDQGVQHERDEMITQVGSKDPAYLSRLKQMGQARGSVSLKDTTAITPRLTLNLDINRVSDPYFLNDFSVHHNLLVNVFVQI